jgi:mono/diheme cytochrome c family protein
MRRIVVAVVIPLIALVSAPLAAQKPEPKPDAKAIEHGQKVFADQRCSMCHSVAGKGNPKGPLDEVGSKRTEEEIRQWLLSPRVMAEKSKSERKPAMPEYTKLPKADLNDLIAYLRTLKKK